MTYLKKALKTIKSCFSHNSSSPSRMLTFFSTLDRLIDAGQVLEGRDYKLEQTADVRLLHLNIDSVHSEYTQTISYAELLTKESLLAYLQTNEAWISFAKTFFNGSQQPVLSVVLNYDILKEKLTGNRFLLNI